MEVCLISASGIIEKLNYPHIGLGILAWFIVLVITPFVIRISHSLHAVDIPSGHKIHNKPIPFSGGICIYISMLLTIFSILRFESFEANKSLFAILFGGLVVMIIGYIDDFKPVPATIKLVLLIVTAYIISLFDVRIDIFRNDLLDTLLTVLWVAGVVSATNSLDNMDGAAAGIGALASIFVFYVAWYSHPPQAGVSYFAITLAGACVGILYFNFHPAKVYLGNNGAFLLGFLLAEMLIFAGWSKRDVLKAIIIPCFILAVPLYDITLSTILRYKNRVVKNFVEAITYCGKDHISHRLIAFGFTPRESVLLLYLGGTISGCIAIMIFREEITQKIYIPVIIGLVIILIIIGMLLDKAPISKSADNKQKVLPKI